MYTKSFFSRSEFSRNVLTLMTGTAFAQAIPILMSPILTRIFTPEEFGVFSIYMSVVFIIASFSCGKYELAIMLPKKKKDSLHLVVLSIIMCSLVSIISIFPFTMYHSQIANFLKSEAVGNYLYFAPLSIFFIGCYQSLFYYYSRQRAYKQISISKIYQAGSMAGINLSTGITLGGAGSLVFAQIISQLIGITNLIKQPFKKLFHLQQNLTYKNLLSVAFEYKKFPLFFSFSYGLNTLAGNLTPFILAISFDLKLAGYYLIVQRAIVGPISIIAKSIGDVFFQKASHQKDCRKLYLVVSGGLFAIGLIPTIIIFFFSDMLFAFFFGEEWRPAGEIAQILIAMFFLSFTTTPVSQFSTIHQKVTYNITWQLALISFMLFSWYLGTSQNNVFIFFISYAILQSILYVIGYFYEFHLCNKQAKT